MTKLKKKINLKKLTKNAHRTLVKVIVGAVGDNNSNNKDNDVYDRVSSFLDCDTTFLFISDYIFWHLFRF